MTETGAHIVVVDDEEDIRETLKEYLELQGFRVTSADGAVELRRLVETESFDVALLDINMPGEDGLSLARYLRESSEIGILMLTAAGDTVDRIVGLEMGADDYMVKPFDLREVLARVKAILRRAGRTSPRADDPGPERVRFGERILDLDAHKLYEADGAEIRITAMEFDLLKAFAEHPNRVLNRDQLLEYAHHRSWEPFDRSIDIRVAHIRRKVERDSTKPEVIKTVRGAGYIFVPVEGG